MYTERKPIWRKRREKRSYSPSSSFCLKNLYYSLYIVLLLKKITRREVISILLARIFPPLCIHAWIHIVPFPLIHHHLGLFYSLCCTGGIYGDAVSGLSSGMLPFANQDRSITRREPGQCAVQIDTAKDGTAADMVEGSFLSLRAQKTADHAL